MAAPSGVKAAILSVDKAAGIINDPRSAAMSILVISNRPQDLLALSEKISEKPVVNVANYGRIGGSLNGKEKFSESVYLTADDKEAINALQANGHKVIHQPLPSDSVISF